MPVTVGLVLAVVVSLRCLLGSAQKAPFFLWLRFGSWDFHHLVVGQTISSGRNYEWYVICCVEIHFGSSQQRNNTVAYHSSDTWRSIYIEDKPYHCIQSTNQSINQSSNHWRPIYCMAYNHIIAINQRQPTKQGFGIIDNGQSGCNAGWRWRNDVAGRSGVLSNHR